MNPVTNIEQHKKFLMDNLTHKEKRLAIEKQIEWSQRTHTTTTVCSKNVMRKKLLKKHRDCIKIAITPIGLNNWCLVNSRNSMLFDKKYHLEGGYQITSCNCNGYVCLEPHFVNYTIENGKKVYYDFTRDYNKETFRWFIPDSKVTQKGLLNQSDVLKTMNEYGRARCKCNINWCFPDESP